jgi:hypothetical protein
LQLFNVVKGISDDQKTELETANDNARANAQILINTMSSNGTTYDQLSSDEQISLTKLGVQAGLGANFFSELMNQSSGKEILTYKLSDDGSQAVVVYKDLTTKTISTGAKLPTSSSSGQIIKSGSLVIPEVDIGAGQLKLENSKKKFVDDPLHPNASIAVKNDYADTSTYIDMMTLWVNQEGLLQDFLTNYPPINYLNPDDAKLKNYPAVMNKLKSSSSDNYSDLKSTFGL